MASTRERAVLIVCRAAVMWIATNIGAGGNSTATILRAVFYYLLKHPQTHQKLISELTAAAKAGKLSRIATWKECQNLPYLEACVKEAERIHPAIGLPLERIVPAEGATICGHYFGAGTVVGMNAWVIHRDQAVFGNDAASWRPERWLCGQAERNKMEETLLTVSNHIFCKLVLTANMCDTVWGREQGMLRQQLLPPDNL